jgi:hypothetical protein
VASRRTISLIRILPRLSAAQHIVNALSIKQNVHFNLRLPGRAGKEHPHCRRLQAPAHLDRETMSIRACLAEEAHILQILRRREGEKVGAAAFCA